VPRPAALQAGRDRVAAAGGRLGGQPPYGWRLAAPGRVEPIRSEQAVRWLVLHLRTAQRLSLQGIADELERLQIPTRAGGVWSRQALHRIVREESDRAVRESMREATG
jgi:hypothetical protein